MNDIIITNIVTALQDQDWWDVGIPKPSHGLHTIKAMHRLDCTGNYYYLTITCHDSDNSYEAIQKSVVDSINDDYNEHADKYTQAEADEILSLITDLVDLITSDMKWLEWAQAIEHGLNDTDITADDILMEYDELRYMGDNIFSCLIRPEGALKSNIPWEGEESDFSIIPYVYWYLQDDEIKFCITVVYGTRDHHETFGKSIAEEQKEAIKTMFRDAVQHNYGVTMEQFLEDNAD